ncbi:monocyte to macrophage differentiation factor isoform X1 [Crotalus tigris]|uniref:monocyte to macrophage differentiation factor isoform X1 n=1 Tax=Crotalus tigris TaxID=88082 RepID=UPI00192FAB99|nr:monocyte to macrophage differentiation factor isoform X1 [Crotalus tigris]
MKGKGAPQQMRLQRAHFKSCALFDDKGGAGSSPRRVWTGATPRSPPLASPLSSYLEAILLSRSGGAGKMSRSRDPRFTAFSSTSREKFMNHPAPANSRYKPTCYEHAANCYTHAFLIFPAIIGSALLHRLSEDQWEKITAWIYGVGLCALFIVSTVFHIISWKKSHLRTMEHCFHMCDRMMIYIFIAASYAPWLNLRELGPLASHMRWFIWLMAAGGAFYVFLYHEKYKIVELFFYLAMGFSPALVVTSMNNTDGLQELAWGGVIYCMGVIFFKSDGIIPFAHAIWHLFVATAAAVHYYAIWKYLYRSPADIILQL